LGFKKFTQPPSVAVFSRSEQLHFSVRFVVFNIITLYSFSFFFFFFFFFFHFSLLTFHFSLLSAHFSFKFAFAKEKPITTLILYSNRILENAIYIYRKFGFKEIPLEGENPYDRADIKMKLNL